MSAQKSPRPAGLSQYACLFLDKQVFPLQRIVTRIGRELDNHVVLQDPRVSRYHAELRLENGAFVLYDLNSTGGTYVNEERIVSATLESGDQLRLASVEMRFEDLGFNTLDKAKRSTAGLEASPGDETVPRDPD